MTAKTSNRVSTLSVSALLPWLLCTKTQVIVHIIGIPRLTIKLHAGRNLIIFTLKVNKMFVVAFSIYITSILFRLTTYSEKYKWLKFSMKLRVLRNSSVKCIRKLTSRTGSKCYWKLCWYSSFSKLEIFSLFSMNQLKPFLKLCTDWHWSCQQNICWV